MIRKMLSAGFVLFAALCLLAGPAAAQDDDDGSDGSEYYEIGSLMGEVLPNGSVDVTGDSCDPGASVTLVASTGDEVDATASDDGSFAANVFVSTDPGTYTIDVTCGDRSGVLGVVITANDNNGNGGNDNNGGNNNGTTGSSTGSGSNGPGTLARTGSDNAGTLAGVGALLVGLGGAALFVGRRRMHHNTV